MPVTIKELSDKEKIFCDHYAAHRNQTAACIEAGYKHPHVAGHKIMKRKHVKKYIDRKIRNIAKKNDITAQRVLDAIADVAFADISDIVNVEDGKITVEDWKSLTKEQKNCIQDVHYDGDGHVRIKFYDKLNALEKLGKHLKLFTEMTETKHTFTQMRS